MIRKPTILIGLFLILLSLINVPLHAQSSKSIQWLTFEQLEDSLAAKPKKVFVDFYTDWCTYCRKMDKVVFTKPAVIELISDQYYAVRFDAESEAEVRFSGRTFINDQKGKSRTPVHQIAQLLGLRNGEFAPPTMVVLDEKFRVKGRYFEYLSSKKLLKYLQ